MARASRPDNSFLFATCILFLFFAKLVHSSTQECATASVRNSSLGSDYDFDSLQTALDFAAEQDGSNCTEIRLLPGEQYFVVRPVDIASSLTVRSIGRAGRATVTMTPERNTTTGSNAYVPFYVLTVWNTTAVEFDNVDFISSPGIINIQNVTNVVVSNCTFSFFIEGALDVYNCPMVTVIDSVFEHNGPVAFTAKGEPFRGHAAGLSVSCYILPDTETPPTITIRDSVFVNNSAFPSQELIQSVSNLFTNFIFTGRGGALTLLLIDSRVKRINVTVDNCMFESNRAEGFGGAVYIIFWMGTAHNATFHRCTFKRNWSVNAGGLLGAFFGPGSRENFGFVNVSHCLFVENEAMDGGGSNFILPRLPVYGGRWNFARYEHCTFERNVATNFASALTFTNPQVFRDRSIDKDFEIYSCTFVNNSHRASTTFGSVFISVAFEGTTVFSGSEGSAIQLAGALVSLRGTLNISNSDTTTTNSGAMHFTTYSQLLLYRGAKIHFESNVGGIGASITTESMKNHQGFNTLLYNPLCFLLYEDSRLPPDQWTNVSIHFSQNKALAGVVGFFPSLDMCSWVQFSDPFFDKRRVLNWTFIDLGNNTNSFHKNDPTSLTWYTQTETHSLEVNENLVNLYAGEKLQLHFTAFDQLGQPVASFIRLVSQNSSNNQEISFDFDPSLNLYGEIDQVISAEALARRDVGLNFSGENLPSQTVLVKNFLQQTSAKDYFIFEPDDCPGGYTLQPIPMEDAHSVCTCNQYNSQILSCNGTLISFMESLWATSTSEANDHLYLLHCPTGYCQCQLSSDSGEDICLYFYDGDAPDDQCSCFRSGVLCGECKNGTGVSALLNNCVTCDEAHVLLIPLLVLVDVMVLVGIVLLLTKPIPEWMYPCFMFLQLLPFITESVQLGFEYWRPGLFYMASGLSFYFPYDACLYNGATPLVTYAVRFVPVLLDSIVFPMTIFYMWRVLKRRYSFPWHSVWIIVLLQYMHTIYTAMSILHCTPIPINYNTTDLRWFVDGEVTCFTGAHLVLSLFAVTVLVICTALIGFTFILTLERFKDVKFLRMLREPLLLVGFKHKWWYSAELAQRFAFVLVAVCSPGDAYPLLFATCIISTVVLYIQPYASRVANFLEIIFLVNTILFFLVSIPEYFKIWQIFEDVDDGPCSVNGTTVYVFSAVLYPLILLYYIPFLATILVVILNIAVVILKLVVRKVKKVGAKSAFSNKRSLRERVYSGLVSRTGVTKTSVLVRIFSSSTLRRVNPENTEENNSGIELDNAQFFGLQLGEVPYKEF